LRFRLLTMRDRLHLPAPPMSAHDIGRGRMMLEHLPALARLDDEITRQALMSGYIDVFYLTTWTSLVSLPLILQLSRPK
jgi:hypothetical protein